MIEFDFTSRLMSLIKASARKDIKTKPCFALCRLGREGIIKDARSETVKQQAVQWQGFAGAVSISHQARENQQFQI